MTITRPNEADCRYCGRAVLWNESKAGKRYLAEPTPIFGEEGNRIKTIYPSHKCPASAEEKQAVDAQIKVNHEAEIERGEVVKGQQVAIFKGRKYPVGTTGLVDWVAREADGFGVVKVRIVLDSGERIYVNRDNVRAAEHAATAALGLPFEKGA